MEKWAQKHVHKAAEANAVALEHVEAVITAKKRHGNQTCQGGTAK